MRKVAITGASGFVGMHLLARLAKGEWQPLPLVRTRRGLANEIVVGSIERTGTTDLPPVDAFIHLAAQTSVGAEGEEAMRLINVKGTANAIELARNAGAKRFIFLSSVKALGEETRNGVAYSEMSEPLPEDAYGRSKLEAERTVSEQCERADIDWTIIRPPLVYGAGAKGNFFALAKLTKRGIPLPFGATRNRRSLVYAGNLADFLAYCLNSKAAQNRILMLADEEQCSTGELIARIARANRSHAILLPVPPALFRYTLGLIGKQSIYRRLFENLCVDSTQARQLGWHQPFTMDQGLRQTFVDSSRADAP